MATRPEDAKNQHGADGGEVRVSLAVADYSQIPMSQHLAATLARASDAAGQCGAAEVALEHVLISLCDDPDAEAVLTASRVDVARLKAETAAYLNALPRQDGESTLAVAPAVSRILEAAAAAARGGRRRDINGAIVLAAIVGDGKSIAAQILQAHGLTFDEAIRALQTALAAAPREPFPEIRPADDILARARERVQSRAAPSLRDIMNDLPRGTPPAESLPRPAVADAPAAGPDHGDDAYLPQASPAPEAPPEAATPVSTDPNQPVGFENPAPSDGPHASGAHEPEAAAIARAAGHRQFPSPDSQLQASQRQGSPGFVYPDPRSAPSYDVELGRPVPIATPPPIPPALPQAPGGWGPPLSGTDPRRPGGLEGAGQANLHMPQQQRGAPALGPYPPDFGARPPSSYGHAPHAQGHYGQTGAASPAPPSPMAFPSPAGAAKQKQRMSRPKTEAGQLVENIPRSMRVGVTERVEIRIGNAATKAMAQGLAGSGTVWQHGVTVTQAMSVRLRAPDGDFFVETASPETQWIENNLGLGNDDFASWRFQITPQSRGWGRLQIAVSARTIGADGVAAETAMPDQMIEVKVRTNYKQAAMRLSGWALAAIAGGALAKFGEGGLGVATMIAEKLMK